MRVAVIGLGWVAREVWLPRLVKHPDFDVVAVVEPRPEAVERAATLVGGARVYGGYQELGPREADLVFVLTPNHTHGAHASHFLRQGLAVFLEKPTGTDFGHLRLLEDAARDGGGGCCCPPPLDTARTWGSWRVSSPTVRSARPVTPS